MINHKLNELGFGLSETTESIRETVRNFAQDVIAPKASEIDSSDQFPRDLWSVMGNLGLLGITVEEIDGGAGLGYLEHVIAMEEIAKVDAAASVIMSVNNSLVCTLLEKYGDAFQKGKYLSKLSKGELLGAFSLSEPQSGSDASNMLTFAKKTNDGYILNGTKNWVTNGQNSDVVLVAALTEKNVGHRGISCFIVEKSFKGFSVGKPEKKLGIKSSDTTELYFDNVEIPKENLIGNEGDGFKICLGTLDGGRIGIAAQALGIAQASLDASVKYSKERKQFDKPISSFQAVQFKLADMSIAIEAARLLTRKAAWLKDKKLNFSVQAAMAKLNASEVAMKASTECVQIYGGYGYMRDYGVERLMRDAKITQIYEGTSEIQRLVIARDLLK